MLFRSSPEVAGSPGGAGSTDVADAAVAGPGPDGPVTPGADAETHVDLVDLLATPDDELLDRHGRWYIARRQARHLRRNALVVLGNVGDPGDPRVVGAVRDALAHDDPLVRGHAVWAARRMGRADLVPADDADPLVREELAAPVEVRA